MKRNTNLQQKTQYVQRAELVFTMSAFCLKNNEFTMSSSSGAKTCNPSFICIGIFLKDPMFRQTVVPVESAKPQNITSNNMDDEK